MDKEAAVKIVLEKRFGQSNPENIPEIREINTFTNTMAEEDAFGIGVQFILSSQGSETTQVEEYQVSLEGVVFSWGKSEVIDERSIKTKFL